MQYYIPRNYTNAGKFLNGMVGLRNGIEAGILGYGAYLMLKVFLITADTTVKLVAYPVVILPLVIFAAIGVGGDSLTQRLRLMMIWARRKRQTKYHR